MRDLTPLKGVRLPVGLIDETAGEWSSLFFSLMYSPHLQISPYTTIGEKLRCRSFTYSLTRGFTDSIRLRTPQRGFLRLLRH